MVFLQKMTAKMFEGDGPATSSLFSKSGSLNLPNGSYHLTGLLIFQFFLDL